MSGDQQRHEGGCTCGQVRFAVTDTPLIVHACHCRWCQRQTGGPHVLNAIIEASLVDLISGEVEKTTVPSPSGEGQQIVRCPKCKVAVWSNYLVSGMGELIHFVRVGTLDDPTAMPPDIHIYTSTKLPWYVIPQVHLAVDEYYDMKTTWRTESLARFKTLKQTAG